MLVTKCYKLVGRVSVTTALSKERTQACFQSREWLQNENLYTCGTKTRICIGTCKSVVVGAVAAIELVAYSLKISCFFLNVKITVKPCIDCNLLGTSEVGHSAVSVAVTTKENRGERSGSKILDSPSG